MKYVVSFLVILCTGTVCGSGSGSEDHLVQEQCEAMRAQLDRLSRSAGLFAKFDPNSEFEAAMGIVTQENLEVKDVNGRTLLVYAVTLQKDAAIVELMEYVHSNLSFKRAIDRLLNDRYTAAVPLLLQQLDDANTRFGQLEGYTFLHKAAARPCLDMVQVLIQDGRFCPHLKAKKNQLADACTARELALCDSQNDQITPDYRQHYAAEAIALETYEQQHDAAGGCEHCRES